MTQEGFRHPRPATDVTVRARVELESLFTPPQPAVQVIVKRRRPGAVVAADPGNGSPSVDSLAPTDGLAPAERGPRVHRLEPPPAPRSASPIAAHAGADQDALTPATGSMRPRRRRRKAAARDSVRQPSPVRIVMQAPAPPAPPAAPRQEEPAWRRILCVPPEAVSYLQVLHALGEVQALLDEARLASGFRPEAPCS
jgi:hypothetical protein